MTAKAPGHDLLSQHIAGFSPAKRALLELKLKKNASNAAARISIPKRPHHSPSPLSFAQQRLWFLSELEPNSPAYNMQVVRRLTGPLNVKALEQALGEIVKRHESLRTRFEDVGGVPQQVIDEAGEWKLKLIDLSPTDENERATTAQRIASEDAQRPFALAAGWGMRAQLLRLDDTDHILVLTMHHIVSDGWSLGVLIGELQELYETYSRGERHSPLPDLPLQYADFSVWQQGWLSTAQPERQLSYWREQLAGSTPAELPIAKSRPAAPSFRGEKQSLRLPAELTSRLHALARTEEATLFMVMFAVFQALLSRYSGQADISVGTPVANRSRAELEQLIGVFVNTLVLRTDLSGDPSFAELLQRVREVALAGYANQDLPFERLVEELQPERSLSRNPLFDVIFAMQNAPRSETKLNGLWWEPWGEGSKTTRVDLEVHVSEVASELVCTFVYATDLFEAETIHRMMGHYKQLLEAVAADPTRRLSQLPVLTSAEREQLLWQWNETASAYPEQLVHELFEAQAEQLGSAIAVRCGDEELTFAELNARANQLAHYLRKAGVGPEILVGICMERSPLLVVSVLAVVKAGGAYVPLDPSYPADRLQFMLEDAAAPVLLTVNEIRDRFSDKFASGANVVCLDSMWKEIAQESPDNPASNVNADNLSYVIFTSGSTGKPKGVGVSHTALLNLVSWHVSTFNVTASDRATILAGVGFDASVWEVWPYLCSGASLEVAPENVRSSPEQLRDWLTERQVTISFVPTPVAEPMLDLEWNGNTKLRTLLTGGDRLHAWPSSSLPFAVVNNYGPTENAVVTTSGLVNRAGAAITTPSLGRPISNVRVYIVDAHGEPVPVEVPGELCIGGIGLGRGYLKRADLTAERFIPDPFAVAGGRIYRTGDRARYLADGSIEYLGRTDHQLKLRGFRIELGEIESALDAHPAVKQAAVVARETTNGSKQLVAYVVQQANEPLTSDDLHTHLHKSLPDYMIPSAFVMLDQLPLTESGKVDRQQLPAPENISPESSETFVAPRTPLEQVVARIWERVLNVPRVGVYDNFFALGGHSLLATKVISRVNESLKIEMSLRALFESPRIADFVQLIEKTAIGESYVWPTVMKIQPLGTRRPIFFVAAPNINALGYIRLADHLGEDQPLYGLQSQKYLKTTTDEHGRPLVEFSQAVVEELANEYVRAMREVQPHGPYLLGGMCRGAHIAFEMATQLKAQGETCALLAILDTWVMENTYSYLFYFDYYFNRSKWFLKLSARQKFDFLKGKLSRSLDNTATRLRITEGHKATLPPVAAVYWPDSSFVPHTYDGRITVFRVANQPATRIRSHALGWESRSTGGVDVEVVPGGHHSLLRQPHVEILAARLTEILAKLEAGNSNHRPN